MARHRIHSLAFKKQIVEEYAAGATLNGLCARQRPRRARDGAAARRLRCAHAHPREQRLQHPRLIDTLLRKATARTKEALWTTIGGLIEAFTPNECRNYLVNSGYPHV
jgi:hypothetical protein